tara:strand:+ start:1089 stop:1313 length:225 start_codon:yes stop_codon:yes gene_type:complete
MFKALVLIWVVSASDPVIIEDKLGPYETVSQCFHRGAVIIRSAFDMTHLAIVKAETICLQNQIQLPEKEKGLAL